MKWWIIIKKKEQTKIYIDNKFVHVTLVVVPNQEIIWIKKQDKDWYNALIIWADKKNIKSISKKNVKYWKIYEFKISDELIEKFNIWENLNSKLDLFENIEKVKIMWISKWKWYQWVVKRHWFAWWPETHWSKFHRLPGSIWNRKPRRVNKWHPLPWHMWSERITLNWVKLLDKIFEWEENILILNWSIPWHYNSYLKLEII